MEKYMVWSFFFFNDTATTEIYTLSLHDALPISATGRVKGGGADLWMLTEWRPRGAYRGAFGDAGGPADQGAASDTAGPGGPMYVQVSTSQNEAWSSGVAQQLSPAGPAARVLPPKKPHDGC